MDELTKFLMSEIWDDIEEFPGYQVSTEGRVRRIKKSGEFHYLTPNLGGGAPYYWTVTLRKNGKGYTRRVHRLMALAFIPNPDPDRNLTIDHLNGNPHDNRLENLKWKSQKRNNHNRVINDNSCFMYKGEPLVEILHGIFGESLDLRKTSVIRNRIKEGFTLDDAIWYMKLSEEYNWFLGRSRRVIWCGRKVAILMLCDMHGLDWEEYRFKFKKGEDVTGYFEGMPQKYQNWQGISQEPSKDFI